MARYAISPGVGMDVVHTDDTDYKNYLIAHYRKQGLTPLLSDDEDDDDLDDYETTAADYERHCLEVMAREDEDLPF